MKFLFTAPRFHTNQAPIVKGLTEAGHEVRYFVVFVGATEDHSCCEPLVLKPSKTTVREKRKLAKTKTASEIESAISGHFIPNWRYLEKQILEYRPDVVICRDRTNFTLAVYSICSKHSIPCALYDQSPVYTSERKAEKGSPDNHHTLVLPLFTRVCKKLQKTFSADFQYISKCKRKHGFPKTRISPVKYLVNEFASNSELPVEHSYYIPLVYAPPKVQIGKRAISDDATHFLCVAKFREYKNLPLLLNAFTKIKTVENWKLTIVGQAVNDDEKAYRNELESYILKNGLSSRISLLQNVRYKDMHEVYSANDLLILPSRRETYGMAIVEAMANGLSVIVSDTCGAAFCAQEAGGTVVKANEVDALATAILDSLQNKDCLIERGKKAKEYILRNQSFDCYYHAMANMLKNEFNLSLAEL